MKTRQPDPALCALLGVEPHELRLVGEARAERRTTEVCAACEWGAGGAAITCEARTYGGPDPIVRPCHGEELVGWTEET